MSMKQPRCSLCGHSAFAYRMETDGSKTYLCLAHLPDSAATLFCDRNTLRGKSADKARDDQR